MALCLGGFVALCSREGAVCLDFLLSPVLCSSSGLVLPNCYSLLCKRFIFFSQKGKTLTKRALRPERTGCWSGRSLCAGYLSGLN